MGVGQMCLMAVISRECESWDVWDGGRLLSARDEAPPVSAARPPERPPRPAARPSRPWHRKNPRGRGSLPSVPFGIVRGC